jgi:hypothetical protein
MITEQNKQKIREFDNKYLLDLFLVYSDKFDPLDNDFFDLWAEMKAEILRRMEDKQ